MNNNYSTNKAYQLKEKLLEYFLNHIISSIVFTGVIIGGCIFLPYYASIHYFPKLGQQDAITYLLMMALTGIPILIFGGVCFSLYGILGKRILKNWYSYSIWSNENTGIIKIYIWYFIPITLLITFFFLLPKISFNFYIGNYTIELLIVFFYHYVYLYCCFTQNPSAGKSYSNI